MKFKVLFCKYWGIDPFQNASTTTYPGWLEQLLCRPTIETQTAVILFMPSLSSCCRFSKHGSLKSHEELELPSELTEDWATMEVCVDCKKFITDIIASSKHSLSLATKRARLKRKTQSFYLSSPKGREEYRPSERTIKEIWNPPSLQPASSSYGTIIKTEHGMWCHCTCVLQWD